MPNIGIGYPDWENYFGDLMNFPIPQIPDQIFLIRPDYNNFSPSSFENIMDEDDEMRSDCSCVDYIVEDENADINNDTDINENMIEVSIETKQK